MGLEEVLEEVEVLEEGVEVRLELAIMHRMGKSSSPSCHDLVCHIII